MSIRSKWPASRILVDLRVGVCVCVVFRVRPCVRECLRADTFTYTLRLLESVRALVRLRVYIRACVCVRVRPFFEATKRNAGAELEVRSGGTNGSRACFLLALCPGLAFLSSCQYAAS